MNYFKVKIRIERLLENGVQRSVTEEYLIDALSWSEAEERIITEMDGHQFSISDIRPFKITEAFLGAQGYYFKARLYFLSLDEKSGREKKTAANMLIQANDIEEAKQILVSEMKKTISDYTIQKIEETKILDVFK